MRSTAMILFLFPVLTTCAETDWVLMENSTVPKDMTNFLTIDNGKLTAACANDKELCELEFDAQLSSEGKLNFLFENACKEGIIYLFNGDRMEVSRNDFNSTGKTNFVAFTNIKSEGKVNDEDKSWKMNSLKLNLVTKVQVKLPKGCAFILVEGSAVVEKDVSTYDSDVPPDNGQLNQAFMYFGIPFGAVVVAELIAIIVLAIYCVKYKRSVKYLKLKADAPTVAAAEDIDKKGIKEGAENKDQKTVETEADKTAAKTQETAKTDNKEQEGAKSPITDMEAKAMLSVVEDVDETTRPALFKKIGKFSTIIKPSDAFVTDDLATINLIENKFVKSLVVCSADSVEVFSLGKKYWLLKSAFDCRAPVDNLPVISAAVNALYLSMNYQMRYFKCDPKNVPLSAADEAKMIAKNKDLFCTRGPPRIDDVVTNEMVVCDSLVEYLYQIRAITDDEYKEMLLFLPNNCFGLLAAEYKFLVECSVDEAVKHWKELMKEREKYLKEQEKLDKVECIGLFKTTKVDTFHRLCLFFKCFRVYFEKFPIKDCHMSRLPLQGLMMLLFRPDLTESEEKKLIGWFKLISFGMLRKRDYGKCNYQIAYPLIVQTKLWHEHDFGTLEIQDVKEIQTLYDLKDSESTLGWDCMKGK